MSLPPGYSRTVSGIYLDDGSGPYMENADGSLSQGLPKKFYTDNDGANARLRVDVAQTGFFAGREFRTFYEWTVSTTEVRVIKAVVPLNIILFELGMVPVLEGEIRIETLLGGTEGGVFGTPLPIFPTNTMSDKPQPPYVNQVLLTTGGTLTGGTLLDPTAGKTSDNANFASSVGAGQGAERGVAANTYYFRMTATALRGIFKARWEERPAPI